MEDNPTDVLTATGPNNAAPARATGADDAWRSGAALVPAAEAAIAVRLAGTGEAVA
jgi:hypothetical protein